MASGMEASFLDNSSATLEDFKLWSVVALKKFLLLRKKPVHGTVEELAAR